MGTNSIRFILLLLLSLLVGTTFGIWVGFNPSSLSAAAYVEQQQNAIRSLNTLLPVMGAVCIALAAWLAVQSKDNSRSRYLLVAAIACLVVAALVTRFGNQPINAQVITWSAQSPPANWAQLRDTWWQLHVVRTLAGILGLSLTLLAVLGSKRSLFDNAA
jgi:cytochrome bd-type quinol oxidase subunit 2